MAIAFLHALLREAGMFMHYLIGWTVVTAAIAGLFEWINYRCIDSIDKGGDDFISKVQTTLNIDRDNAIIFCKASYGVGMIFEALTVMQLSIIGGLYLYRVSPQIHIAEDLAEAFSDTGSSLSGDTLDSVAISLEEIPTA